MFVAFDTMEPMEKKDTKINIMLTAKEARLIEDMALEERQRSLSSFGRTLLLEAVVARGRKLPESDDSADAL